MTERLLHLINEKYPLTEMDCGDFAKMKAGGMEFDIRAYKADGLGQVSVMVGKGFFGLMKMDTLIINPTAIDLPLYSYDRIFAMGNDTLIVELYDTLSGEYSEAGLEEAKAKYTAIPERDPGEHWYDSIKLSSSISKKGKKTHTTVLDSMTVDHFVAYLNSNDKNGDPTVKQSKASAYVSGLIEKGGPSTDVFKKAIGEKKTRQLFENILFGTK